MNETWSEDDAAAAAVAEVRRRRPSADVWQIHTLMYYVQGYHLVWHGTAAFAADIEACEQGPVVSGLRVNEPCNGSELVPCERVRNLITWVLANLGDLSGSELAAQARTETPWMEATDSGRDITCRPISHRCMTEFFSVESDDLKIIRSAIAAVRDDREFVPDPPGLREELIARYVTS